MLSGFETCTVEDVVMGFFTGTESDPTVTNSLCVRYYPELHAQIELIISELNSTLLVPYNFLQLIDDSATLINKYSVWQNYCVFGTLFTALDNVLETFDGITTVVYRFILGYAEVLTKIGNLTTAYTDGECRETFQAAGEIFSILFAFNVPEDII